MSARHSALPARLPPELARALTRYSRRLRLWRVLDRLALLALAAGGIVCAGCAFDRWIDTAGLWRLPWAPAALLTAGRFGFQALAALFRHTDYDAVAHALDVARGDTRGHLRSQLDFSARADAGPFAALSRQRAAALWRTCDAAPYVAAAASRRRLTAAVLFVAGLLALGHVESVRARLLLQRFFNPLGNHPRPSATWFEIEAPERIDGGDTFRLVTRLRGRPVAAPAPVARLSRAGGAESVRSLQPTADGAWELELTDVSQDFDYLLSMPPSRSARRMVRVRPRPMVLATTAAYTYPLYTGLKPRTETLAGRTLTALEGTKVAIELVANIPLRSAQGAVDGEERPFRIDRQRPDRATRHHFINRNERLDLVLVAENGLENRHEQPYNIRAVPDKPPTVSARPSWGEHAVRATDTVHVFFKVQDDIGIAEVALKAEQGSFVQEAELTRYGAREAEGVITVPVASLTGPDTARLKLRVTALDLKGQLASGPPLTLHIAVNSYDRQCRTARNALLGTPHTRNINESGFPSLPRAEQRLQAIKELDGKLTILLGTLPATGKPGPANERMIADIRQTLRTLAPNPAYIIPSIGGRADDITTSFDLLTAAELTPRLAAIVAESVTAPDLAIAADPLLGAFDAALAAAEPRPALAAFAARIKPARNDLEAVCAHLARHRTSIERELAGYLCATLVRDLDAASSDATRAARLQDRDFLITRHAMLREAAGLLGQSNAATNLPGAVTASLAQAAAQEDAAQALRASHEPLAQALPLLEAAAAASAAEPRAPLAAPPLDASERARLDIQGLRLIMRIDDRDGDELGLLLEAAAHLETVGGGATAAACPTPAFACYAALARFRAACEVLRLGLASGELTWESPSGDLRWTALRELRVELLQALAALPPHAPLRPGVASLAAEAAPAAAWCLPAEPPLHLAATLVRWEALARSLAAAAQPAALAEAEAALQPLRARWRTTLLGTAQAYRAAIGRRVQEIASLQDPGNPHLMQQTVFSPLPRMYARNKAMHLLLNQYLGLREALLYHRGGNPAADADLLDAAAALVLVRRIEKELFANVGRPISNVNLSGTRDDAFMGEGAKTGKVKAWGEVDALVADLERLLRGEGGEAGREALLQRLVVRHHLDAERMAMAQTARLLAYDAPSLAQDLKGDRGTAPALWAEIQCGVAALADAPAPPDAALLAPLRLRLDAAGALPRELSALPGLLAATDDWDRRRHELSGVLADLAALARPPAVLGGGAALADRLLAAQRARLSVRLALAPPGELGWAAAEVGWTRRKTAAIETHVGIGGLAVVGTDDLANLKLPLHLYQELKRARESVMPELYRERAYRYLNRLMENAR